MLLRIQSFRPLDTNLLGLRVVFVTFLHIYLRKTRYSPESQGSLDSALSPVENSRWSVENFRGTGEILGKSWGNLNSAQLC
ncbi:hypothetical protein Syn6312_2978 [Synechococcus sp. PCC 6312]|nr:hypothetical protein Syn6312_2978 [Synechococcus sp. PCC 6312]